MIRIGIVGAGKNAGGHVQYYAKSDRAKVVAVADVNLPAAEALAATCGARATADYRCFLDAVDAVVISSPNFLHAEQAVVCAEAGKHVYCEKPMGLDLAEARRIADAVAQAGVQSAVGFSVRFAGNMQALLRRVRAGDLGRLVSVWSRRLMYIDPATVSGWRRDPAKSGGLLLEINVHELDWMMAAGGDVRSVYARAVAEDSDHPRANDHLWIVLNFAEGAVGSHEGSWRSSAVCFYRGCHGTAGALATDEWGGGLLHTPVGGTRSEAPVDPAFDKHGNFLDAIEGRAPSVVDARWGLRVMTVAEAIFESVRTGHVVSVADLASAR